MNDLPKLDVVIGNNFGYLPMFIGAEKGFFKKHGVDAKMRWSIPVPTWSTPSTTAVRRSAT